MTIWMLYASLFAALAAVGGFALDHAARALRLPARFVWLATLVVAMAGPVALPPLVTADLPSVLPEEVLVGQASPVEFDERDASRSPAALRVTDAVRVLDRPLLLLWIALSALCLGRFAKGMIALRRKRAQWIARDVEGTPLLVTPDLWPAVVAIPDTRIIVPEWMLSLDEASLATVIRHERQHTAAGDAWLIITGAVGAALVPWNPAVWLIRRRLRLALEMDCDARVLAEDPRVDRYGSLLLSIAQHPRLTASLGATLTESTSDLERRIDAMTARPPKHPRLRASLFAATAVAAVAIACAMPAPDVVAPRAADPLAKPAFASDVMFDFQVEQPAAALPTNRPPRYPAQLIAANISGSVIMQFVVDTMGLVDMRSAEVNESDHEGFTTAVREALPELRFTPARVGGRPVKQLVRMPFTFSLVRGAFQVGKATETPSGKRVVTFEMVGPPNKPMVLFEGSAEPTDPTPLGINEAPEYPAALRAAGVQGSVFVSFLVRKDGTVDMSSLKVARSDHAAFLASVRATLERWRFRPAVKDGSQIEKRIDMPFMFRLMR